MCSTHTIANQMVACCDGLVNVSPQVKALYGGNGGGGLKGAQIAVCTIEKANALINRMAAAEVSLRHTSIIVMSGGPKSSVNRKVYSSHAFSLLWCLYSYLGSRYESCERDGDCPTNLLCWGGAGCLPSNNQSLGHRESTGRRSTQRRRLACSCLPFRCTRALLPAPSRDVGIGEETAMWRLTVWRSET